MGKGIAQIHHVHKRYQGRQPRLKIPFPTQHDGVGKNVVQGGEKLNCPSPNLLPATASQIHCKQLLATPTIAWEAWKKLSLQATACDSHHGLGSLEETFTASNCLRLPPLPGKLGRNLLPATASQNHCKQLLATPTIAWEAWKNQTY